MPPTLPTAVKDLYFRAKYLLSDDVVTYEVDGSDARFLTHSYAEFRRFQSLMGEEAVISELLANLRPDDVFFDVGANVGTYACLAAGKLPDGHTVAFEPEPTNAARLRENANLNGLDIEIHQLALSDADGAAHLERVGAAPGAGQHALADDESDRTVEVAQRTGDQLIEAGVVPVPTVLKIDVEGAELKVLGGLSGTLARDSCRLVFCEVHPERLRSFGHDVDQVRDRLASAGFTVSIRQRLGDKFFISAEHVHDQ